MTINTHYMNRTMDKGTFYCLKTVGSGKFEDIVTRGFIIGMKFYFLVFIDV